MPWILDSNSVPIEADLSAWERWIRKNTEGNINSVRHIRQTMINEDANSRTYIRTAFCGHDDNRLFETWLRTDTDLGCRGSRLGHYKDLYSASRGHDLCVERYLEESQ